MNRRILISLFTSGFQTFVYYLVFYLSFTIGTIFHEPTSMTISEAVGFGAFLKFSIIMFGIIVITMNLIDAFFNKRKWTLTLLIVLTAICLVYWRHTVSYIPLKTILFLVSGIIAIYSKIPIDKILKSLIRVRIRTSTQQ